MRSFEPIVGSVGNRNDDVGVTLLVDPDTVDHKIPSIIVFPFCVVRIVMLCS